MSRTGLVLVAAVVVLVMGGVWLLVTRGQPPVGACGRPRESPSAASAAPVAARAAIEWAPVPLPDELTDGDDQTIADAAAFNGGFVAVGTESSGGDWRAFILWSRDGAEWAEVGGAAWRGVEFSELHVAGTRLFALGSASTNDRGGARVVVAYTDDGTTWHEAAGDFATARPPTLAGDDAGSVLIGGRFEDLATVGWRSTDGTEWEPVDLELPVAAAVAGIAEVTVDEGRWLGIGSISVGPDSPAAPVAWTSDDGVRWVCTLMDAAGFEVAQPTQLYRGPDGWLATGGASSVCGPFGSCAGTPMAWTSADGATWSAGFGDGQPLGIGGVAFARGPAGFIAVGQGNAWASADGSTWARAETGESGHAIMGQTDALAVSPDGTRVVAAGTLYAGDGTDPDPWIAVGEVTVEP